MIGITDVLTSLQNAVQAINAVAQTYLSVQGAQNKPAIATATLVKAGAGRIAVVSVTTAGAAGKIYDSTDITSTTTPIYVIPAVLGVTVVNLPFAFGLVIAPGAAQVVTVSYS